MHDNNDYTIDVVWAVRERLEPYGIVSAPLHAPDGVSFSRNGHEDIVPDLLSIVADFAELGADPEHVGDAIAALVLDEFSIEHDVPSHGLTIALCGRAV